MTLRRLHPDHHPMAVSYPVSPWQRVYSMTLIPLILLVLIAVVLKFAHVTSPGTLQAVSWSQLLLALGASFWRIAVAYALSLLFAIPLALLATHSRWSERILLPFFDVIESVPVLAFFPVIILLFVKYDFFDGAAIFIIFIDMMWSILFTVVVGLKTIPGDILLSAQVFGIRGMDRVRRVLLPAITPHIVTGSILAWGTGWNIIIVAEVIHTYLPGGNTGQDLFGIGSVLVHASENGQHGVFLASVIILVVAIALLNIVVWQRLLHYAERFKFE